MNMNNCEFLFSGQLRCQGWLFTALNGPENIQGILNFGDHVGTSKSSNRATKASSRTVFLAFSTYSRTFPGASSPFFFQASTVVLTYRKLGQNGELCSSSCECSQGRTGLRNHVCAGSWSQFISVAVSRHRELRSLGLQMPKYAQMQWSTLNVPLFFFSSKTPCL